jgi:hypothetical protein
MVLHQFVDSSLHLGVATVVRLFALALRVSLLFLVQS